MSFFNLRRGGQSSKSAGLAAPAESLEIVRKRAKHRLVGSAVLVLLGVIGFPLLFDTQPRPVSVGIPIEIPSKQGTKALSLASPAETVSVEPSSAGATGSTTSASASASSVAAAASSVAATETATAKAPAPAVAAPLSESKPAADKPADKTVAAKADDDAARAKRLLEVTPPAASPVVANPPAAAAASASSGDLRLVVQVGAFADAAKAREVRLKLEKAGLKTYTHVAETKDGKRIRVRVGPLASKADADKVVKQIKALNLPAAVLTL